jgi:glycosyltransferase involved in cell wall biosynthesis
MKALQILIDTLVDDGLPNAQMGNGREIIARLNPDQFHVTAFHVASPDPRISRRPNTKLIQLPPRGQTLTILRTFLFGSHDVLFYVKASPASKAYMSLRRVRGSKGLTLGSMESQANLRDEPTISKEAIRLIEQTILRSDYLFSNSRFVQHSLQTNYGRTSEVVPTGVDTKYFSPQTDRAPNPRPIVLFVGSLRPFKGPEFVLDAAQRVPEADFVLVGDGLLMEQLRSRSAELANVRMTGVLSPEQVRSQYQQADIFLFPSRWEGSPKVLAESAACGIPSVARRDYNPETVIHGQTGLLAGDEPGLLEALQRLVKDTELRRSMGRAARQHILAFDWDGITRQWEQIFLRLTSFRGRRS